MSCAGTDFGFVFRISNWKVEGLQVCYRGQDVRIPRLLFSSAGCTPALTVEGSIDPSKSAVSPPLPHAKNPLTYNFAGIKSLS